MTLKNGLHSSVLKFAQRYPHFVPKRLKLLGEMSQSSIVKNWDSELTTIGLFDSRLKWEAKGVHFLVRLKAQDVNQVAKWHTQHHSNRIGKLLLKPMSVGATWGVLGNFLPKNIKARYQVWDNASTLKIEQKYFENCSVNWYSWSKGVFFLSMYLNCDRVCATELLKDVDVKDLQANIFINSLNPFSKKKPNISGDSVYIKAVSRLEENLAKIELSAIQYINSVLMELGVKKLSNYNSVSTFDFFLDEEKGYERKLVNITEKDNENLTILDEGLCKRSFAVSDDLDEALFLNPIGSFTGMYINISQKDEDVSTLYKYRTQHLSNSHNAYSLILFLRSEYSKIHKSYERRLINSRNSISKKYNILYEISLMLHDLNKTLSSIKMHQRKTVGRTYTQKIKEDIQKIETLINDFSNEIEQEKKITNELIQAENLSYHKYYSKVVFILIIIQILIGVMSIN
ncbi:hypothetical protein ACEQ2M_001634 [Vibrio parahaemolyticus]